MFDVHVASSRIIKSQGTCTVAGTRQFWQAKVIAYITRFVTFPY